MRDGGLNRFCYEAKTMANAFEDGVYLRSDCSQSSPETIRSAMDGYLTFIAWLDLNGNVTLRQILS